MTILAAKTLVECDGPKWLGGSPRNGWLGESPAQELDPPRPMVPTTILDPLVLTTKVQNGGWSRPRGSKMVVESLADARVQNGWASLGSKMVWGPFSKWFGEGSKRSVAQTILDPAT